MGGAGCRSGCRSPHRRGPAPALTDLAPTARCRNTLYVVPVPGETDWARGQRLSQHAAAVRVRLHTLVALAQEVAAAAGDAVPRELKLRELLRMAQEVCRSQEASVAEATERAKASAVRSCITKASAEAQALVAEGVDASREQLLSLVEMASEVKLREMADHAAREVNAKAAGVRTQLANLLSTIKTAKAEDASGTHSSTQLGDQMRELISLAKQVAKAEVAAELEATKAAAAAEAEACAKAVAVHGHLEALVRVAVAIADSDDVRVPTADPQFKQLALQLRVQRDAQSDHALPLALTNRCCCHVDMVPVLNAGNYY